MYFPTLAREEALLYEVVVARVLLLLFPNDVDVKLFRAVAGSGVANAVLASRVLQGVLSTAEVMADDAGFGAAVDVGIDPDEVVAGSIGVDVVAEAGAAPGGIEELELLVTIC